jgi:hypothetical protein
MMFPMATPDITQHHNRRTLARGLISKKEQGHQDQHRQQQADAIDGLDNVSGGSILS